MISLKRYACNAFLSSAIYRAIQLRSRIALGRDKRKTALRQTKS